MAAEQNIDAERVFEAWWEREGQYIRAGGGEYEKSFAYGAWMARRPSASIGEDGLPELPETERHNFGVFAFTADQMRQYAGDAIAADRRARASSPEIPDGSQGVKTWQERYKEACSGPNEPAYQWHYMKAEIADLRAQLASERQAKEYEQRHAVESEKALAEVQAQLARQSQGNRLLPREAFASDDAYANYLQEWAAPPLSSEQQAEKGEKE